MKKFLSLLLVVLMAALLLGIAAAEPIDREYCYASTGNWYQYVKPSGINDQKLSWETYNGYQEYTESMNFYEPATAAMLIYERVYDEPINVEEMLSTLPDSFEVTRYDDHAIILGEDKANGAFYQGLCRTSYYLFSRGIVAFFYHNDALTPEQLDSDLRFMAESVQLVAKLDPPKKTETSVSSIDELCSFLAEGKTDSIEEMTITLPEELYLTLSDNRFAAMMRLCYESSMKSFDLRYSSAQHTVMLSDVVYSDVCTYAFAETLEQADAAVAGFIANGLTEFNLGCSDAIFEELWTNRGMYTTMAKAGVNHFSLMSRSGMLMVSQVELFKSPYAIVDDVYSAADQIAAWREEGLTQFNLVYGQSVYSAMTKEELNLVDFIAGINRSNARTNTYGGVVSYGYYDNVSWVEGQSVYCPTENDIVTAIRVLGTQGATTFRLMTTPELFAELRADSFARLHDLEKQAGMTGSRMSYASSAATMMYSEAMIVADATMLSTLEEVIAYVNECVARQDTQINLFLTADVYNDLMSGLSRFQIGKSNAKIFDLLANAGIADCQWMYSRDTHIITVDQVTLYAGTRILQAVQSGNEAALNARDQEALAAARAMAAACAAPTELEALKNIHDALCAKIVYTDDDATDEDDCAIGAILTGEANCDGYADALYLIGHLSGLDVRYQHGDSVKQGLGSMFATHMWNVVSINGTWRLVDVTWDDQPDSAPLYAWFNIGEDRAAKTHVWSREMTVAMDPVTDLSARLETEYAFTTLDDVTAAIQDANSKGIATFCLYQTEASTLQSSEIKNAVRDTMPGSFRYMWLDGMNCMRIFH